jgi:hypothetical protein
MIQMRRNLEEEWILEFSVFCDGVISWPKQFASSPGQRIMQATDTSWHLSLFQSMLSLKLLGPNYYWTS